VSIFSRTTQNNHFLPLWDGLRAVAILLVFFQHLLQELIKTGGISGVIENFIVIKLIAEATIGVELFFVISGFLLTLQFKKNYLFKINSTTLKNFYFRRLIRIGMPYFIHLIIIFIILIVGGELVSKLMPILFEHIFFITNITEGRFSENLLNTVLWSVEIEMQFYIILPFLASFIVLDKDKRFIVLILSIFIIFFIKHLLIIKYNNFPTTILDYFPYFVVGILLSDICYEKKEKNNYIYDVLCIFSISLMLLVFQVSIISRSLVVTFLLFITIFSMYHSLFIKKIIKTKILLFIGGISYSFYLWHLPVLKYISKYCEFPTLDLGYLNYFALFFIYLIPVLIISSLMYLLIEKPFMIINNNNKIKK
jgi:peptidoglycan/LPS O-acetylase OafA/YrhL